MKEAEQEFRKKRGNFSPCGMCKYNNGSPYEACYDCVGDHNKFTPDKEFKQFLAKVGYEIKPRSGKNTVIVIGFPGVGKSRACEYLTKKGVNAIDLDSTKFKKDKFPQNYLTRIRTLIGSVDVIFVSAHKEVCEAIDGNREIMDNYPVYICYPDKKLKENFIKRYLSQAADSKFIEILDMNFDKWVDEIESHNWFYPLKIESDGIFLNFLLYETPLSTL